jgi:hypothetical protein
MKRRFCIQPRADAVGLQFISEVACHSLITRSVDRERKSRAVFVEGVWQKLKMTDEKDCGGQCDVDHTGQDQVSEYGVLHYRCAS